MSLPKLDPLYPKISVAEVPTQKREPVVLWGSVLAALHVLFAGWAGVQVLNHNEILAAVGIVGNLAVAAAQVGVSFYVRGQVTPVEDSSLHYIPEHAYPEGALGQDDVPHPRPVTRSIHEEDV